MFRFLTGRLHQMPDTPVDRLRLLAQDEEDLAVLSAHMQDALVRVADSYIQLLTPTRDDSPVAKYLEKKGEGLHHVGYRVADCAAALHAVKASGGRVIDESPRPASRGTIVAFVHPKTSFGTLIELVEDPAHSST